MFEVKKSQCNQCLFSDNKIVSEDRKKEILRETGENSHFICHKASIEGNSTCCKWFFDNIKNSKIQMAERLWLVKEVD